MNLLILCRHLLILKLTLENIKIGKRHILLSKCLKRNKILV